MPDPLAHARRPDLAALASRLVSLGANCELGIVQQRCETEPLSLLRFAYTPLDGLMAALKARFDGIADPAQLAISVGGTNEFVVRHQRYGFLFHTLQYADKHTERDIKLHFLDRRLPLLSRTLLQDLKLAEKLFVFRAEEGQSEEQGYSLLAALREYGPGFLLWVGRAQETAEAGTATLAGDGLIIGALDRLAPIWDAQSLPFESWASVIGEAVRVWDQAAPAARELAAHV